jgi:hypothetical protein
MSSASSGTRGRPLQVNGGTSLIARAGAQPGDEQLTWTRQALETMNTRFAERMERAFARGGERRASASSQVDVPTGRAPRLSTPLCPEVWIALLRSTPP